MNWRDILRALVGTPARPARPDCRLTETQALDIARTAIAGQTPLVVLDVVRTTDGLHWRIGTATIGSGTTVTIKDATGAVSPPERWGVR